MPVKRPQSTAATTESATSSDVVTEPSCVDEDEPTTPPTRPPRGERGWKNVGVWVVLPVLAFLLAIAAGLLKWQYAGLHGSDVAAGPALQAARDGTVAMLTYRPDTVEQDLTTARDFLTGDFRDSYSSLVNDVVIPGAREQQVSAEAKVAAAATVSAGVNRAVVLVFVNQTTAIGNGPPSDLASTVRVTLDNVGGRWLISDFTPI
ncbi:hypothetical protein AU195_08400 [Mycobacterium sp. IS-1496]|uniref:hypothetical protein n=1 Tax=Mycobacterium sp. IS-1496 TaxID=1772284 RepID=UPI0007416074|nr:hypothetical protein [Mycobacterium sp. IS-1496]KUI31768.1 hypothetical protein AU195_08400 [Mycobacterium sp. IS-1496]